MISKNVFAAIRAAIQREGLVQPGDTVVVGVSGGPDSLCLLHVLRILAGEWSLHLHVAHLNHGLRAEAESDARFVQELADSWGLPATVETRDVAAFAAERHLAIEEAARQVRYGFLGRVALATGGCVAVAHHADDQAESVLMHLIRGSGLSGLRGMRPRSDLAGMQLDTAGDLPPGRMWLIRPLLGVTRAEIEAYCAENGLQPRFDLSNLDQTYFRNWLRHTVLPLLAEHNPGVRQVLCRTAEVAAADYEVVQAAMRRAWDEMVRPSPGGFVFDLAGWRELPLALQRATVREAIHRLRRHLRNINFVHVERAVDTAGRGSTGDQATLVEGLVLTVSYDRFTIAGPDYAEVLPDLPLLDPGVRLPVSVPGSLELPGSDWVLRAGLVSADAPWRANPDPWTAFLDAAACAGSLVLRTRLPGDRIAPQGMGGRHVKLNELMINSKIPPAARLRMPVLACESAGASRPVWACGLRIDEGARVTPATTAILRLQFTPS